MSATIRKEAVIKKIKDKLKFHKGQSENYKSSYLQSAKSADRISGLKANERVIAYEEILEFAEGKS